MCPVWGRCCRPLVSVRGGLRGSPRAVGGSCFPLLWRVASCYPTIWRAGSCLSVLLLAVRFAVSTASPSGTPGRLRCFCWCTRNKQGNMVAPWQTGFHGGVAPFPFLVHCPTPPDPLLAPPPGPSLSLLGHRPSLHYCTAISRALLSPSSPYPPAVLYPPNP